MWVPEERIDSALLFSSRWTMRSDENDGRVEPSAMGVSTGTGKAERSEVSALGNDMTNE